jgi:hypothetical protein
MAKGEANYCGGYWHHASWLMNCTPVCFYLLSCQATELMEINQATWSFCASGFLLFVNGDWLRNI